MQRRGAAQESEVNAGAPGRREMKVRPFTITRAKLLGRPIALNGSIKGQKGQEAARPVARIPRPPKKAARGLRSRRWPPMSEASLGRSGGKHPLLRAGRLERERTKPKGGRPPRNRCNEGTGFSKTLADGLPPRRRIGEQHRGSLGLYSGTGRGSARDIDLSPPRAPISFGLRNHFPDAGAFIIAECAIAGGLAHELRVLKTRAHRHRHCNGIARRMLR
jgi:hypothetical protein